MKLYIALASMCFLIICWLVGVQLGVAKVTADATERDRPYTAIMHEAVDRLRKHNVPVDYPDQLPPIFTCGTCLARHKAFGAYEENLDGIIVPENFDVTTTEGHSILIHEYGHYLMSKAGIPEEQQEPLCLMLGNSVYQELFAVAATH